MDSSDKNPRPSRRSPHFPLEGFVRIDAVLSVYPVSKTTLYDEIRAKTFPAPIKVGRTAFWDAVAIRKKLVELGATMFVPSPEERPDSPPILASSSSGRGGIARGYMP